MNETPKNSTNSEDSSNASTDIALYKPPTLISHGDKLCDTYFYMQHDRWSTYILKRVDQHFGSITKQQLMTNTNTVARAIETHANSFIEEGMWDRGFKFWMFTLTTCYSTARPFRGSKENELLYKSIKNHLKKIKGHLKVKYFQNKPFL